MIPPASGEADGLGPAVPAEAAGEPDAAGEALGAGDPLAAGVALGPGVALADGDPLGPGLAEAPAEADGPGDPEAPGEALGAGEGLGSCVRPICSVRIRTYSLSPAVVIATVPGRPWSCMTR